jgi:cytochrome o ubiquinol oxidase subunit 2
MSMLSGFAVLEPGGSIALAERGLMINAVLFMLIVAIPVLALLFFFAWHYRAGNKKAAYTPQWQHGKMEELVWWAIPFEIVLILGALTWTSTHDLDPRKPLDEALGKPLVVQVVALEWKWLFIYPEERIATINYAGIPTGRPVRFEVTADAPMNSFWIPELGGQIYAMTGMINPIHLIADVAGSYKGLSANYSGDGFAQMKFVVDAMSPEDYEAWVKQVALSPATLDEQSYATIREKSVETEPRYYRVVVPTLFSAIVSTFESHSLEPGAHH